MIQMVNAFPQKRHNKFLLWVILVSCIILSACSNIHPEQIDQQECLVNDMRNAIDEGELMLEFKEPLFARDVYDAYIYLYQYDPYAIGLTKSISVKSDNDEYVNSICFSYSCSSNDIAEKRNAMNYEIDRALTEMSIVMSAKDKASYIYSYLLNGFEYCDDSDYCNTAYSALVEKRGNCQGLAKAFVLLCSKADIDAGYIVGTYDDIPHMWNYVNIDGMEYQYDLTKGVEESEKYLMKELFDDNRISCQQINYFSNIQ